MIAGVSLRLVVLILRIEKFTDRDIFDDPGYASNGTSETTHDDVF